MIAKFSRKIRSLLSVATNPRASNSSRPHEALVLGQPVFLASVLITALLIGVRQLGGLQSLELAVFDQMVRMQPNAGSDPRLLVVAITEADIQTLKQWPVSDQTLAQLLEKLQQYQPKVIGLDLYRNIPQPPGNRALLKQLTAPNIIAITKLDDADVEGVPPPSGIPKERIGFNDLLLDPDEVIRRNLIFASTGTDDLYSFSLRLSLGYLASQGIELKISPTSLQLGKTVFVPIDANSGGYQMIDAQGYQVLLNYRSDRTEDGVVPKVAQQVTLTQVLNGQLNPNWVKDKIVLIGTTAPSAKDLFSTPYSAALAKNPKLPGVLVHAQMVSQILSTVLDKRPLFWFWSEWREVLWVWGWSLVGGMLAWQSRHPLYLGAAGTAALGGLYGISCGIFTQAGWVPVVAPALALVATSGSIMAYKQTALQTANQHLANLAFLDGLTQVANRRRFDEYLTLEWQRLARETAPLSLILCDVDYFKRYNDAYGHPAGDACLQQVAGVIRRVIKRPADLVARYGGEEFAVLLPNTNASGAVHLANAIHKEVQQLLIPHAKSSVSEYVTLSVGVSSTLPQKEFSPEALIAVADKALYEAKEQGRNRVIVRCT